MGLQRVGHDWATELNWAEGYLEEWAILPKGGKWFKNFKEDYLSWVLKIKAVFLHYGLVRLRVKEKKYEIASSIHITASSIDSVYQKHKSIKL